MAGGSVPESGIELTTVRSTPGSATISGEEWWGALGSGQISSTTRAITSQSAGPRVSENGCLRLISDCTTTFQSQLLSVGFVFCGVFPAPRGAWAKSACATSSVACRNSPRFRLISILFCSLFSNKSAERLSVGTRRTPLLSGTYTCVEKMRFSTWSGRQPCATHVGDQPFGGMNSNSLRCASQSSGTSACRPRVACKFRWRG